MKLLVINGPNLNLLGIREPDIYGRQDFSALEDFICASAAEFGVEVELFQSNYEGAIVEKIQEAYGKMDGIVINPGLHPHQRCHSGRAESRCSACCGGPPLKRQRPGTLPPDLLSRHGL